MATDKKTGWFTFKDILSKQADVNLVISGRSNGKTYSALKYVLQDFKKNKKCFVWVRRWHDDVKLSKAQKLFLPLHEVIVNLFGADYDVVYANGNYYLVDPDGEKTVIGYIVALSDSHHLKSVSFVNIGTIVYDEFIRQAQAGEKALPDELGRWESILSTVIRFHTDIKIFCLANTCSKYAPLLQYYKIPINQMKIGDIFTQEFPTEAGTLKVACEYAEVSKEVKKKTSKYILDSDMILNGEWELPKIDEIPISAAGEHAKELLLFSAFDPTMEINIGVYIRHTKWYTLEKEGYLLVNKEHEREFLVIRESEKKSSYFHLTTIKDLKYNTYTDWDKMMKDILDQTGVDVMNELWMNRVYCDNMFTADYFVNIFKYYQCISLREVL